MKIRYFILSVTFVFAFTISVNAQVNLQSPSEFLGYELGDHFTPHHQVLAYFKHVAANSDMVQYESYGLTHERRELILAVVSSSDNIDRVDEIRKNNLRRTGLEEGPVNDENIPVVWLSYNVHGNETSSSEAAMLTLWELVNPENEETKAWLKNSVVVMDPMINPDGRDRYVNWFNTTVGDEMNAYFDSREHHEPWPGGRVNHYLHDLNRDWAWQTQLESRLRVKQYHMWMPHVHVDFHEQFYNEDYYFAPAAKPYHTAITEWQRDFQDMIGKNHATYFDQNDWLYFTKEVFDLFYPSYGDTYPTFNGAIGMTYEQAGHSYAGLGIIKAEGDTLTLLDRLTHHTTTGLSTVEVTWKNRDQVVTEFQKYFDDVRQNGSGEYNAYVVRQDNDPDKLAAFLKLLDRQAIQYGQATSTASTSGFDFQRGTTGRAQVNKGDIVISAKQPQGNLVRVLMEPNPVLDDSVTYDMTAWSLFYAHGIDGLAVQRDVAADPYASTASAASSSDNEDVYAFIMEWKSTSSVKFLAELLKRGVQPRYAEYAFSMNGKEYDAGTLIITENGNEKLGASFEKHVREAAQLTTMHELVEVSTGLVDSGKDFGSGDVTLIKKPRVLVAAGEGTNPNETGYIWHYFDKQIDYPVTMANLEDLGSIDWNDYDVFIMPSGSYSELLTESGVEKIQGWIRGGGKLLAVGGANRSLAGRDGFALKRKSSAGSGEDGDDLPRYEDRQRSSISNGTPGAIYKVSMDNSHPLAFGYGDHYHALRFGSTAYDYLDNGWSVGVVKEDDAVAGFVGYKAKEQFEKSLAFGVQNYGAGKVIYLIDNPLYRSFWENGKLLFGNAVFF